MSRRVRRAAAEAGLTLVEMLVVLAIIGVVAGATVLSLAPRRGNPTEAEARQLATAVQTAADASLATGNPALLTVDARGYALGGVRHALPAAIVVDRPPATALPLGLDAGRPFALDLAAGSDRWTVTFDGLRAEATRAAGQR